MSELTPRERAAIEAIARRFAAVHRNWDGRGPGAWLTVGRERIALEVVTIAGRKDTAAAKPRLRFDRVVQAVDRRLRAALEAVVPQGQTMMIAITAPIRQPGKTAAALAERLRDRLRRPAARVMIDATLYGNRIRAAQVKGLAPGAPKSIVFVHNPDADADVPGALFGATRQLLEHVGAAPTLRRAGRGSGGRWLALVTGKGLSDPTALQQIVSRLGIPASYREVLLVPADGRVETLAG